MALCAFEAWVIHSWVVHAQESSSKRCIPMRHRIKETIDPTQLTRLVGELWSTRSNMLFASVVRSGDRAATNAQELSEDYVVAPRLLSLSGPSRLRIWIHLPGPLRLCSGVSGTQPSGRDCQGGCVS